MIVRILLAGALLAAATPASAQALDPDVRCMLVSNLFAQAEKDPQRKQLSAISSVFYFGKVSARLNPAQIKQQLQLLDKAVKPAELPAVMTNCAKQFQAKQQAFLALGRSVAPKAPAGPPPAK
jgi:hypothetical protein